MTNPGPLEADVEQPLTSPFRVGEWIAEPAWNRIRRNSETVKLEPLVMRLLAKLAAAPGRPLRRQVLLDTIWPDTIVNEEALSRAVSQLRRALGDDPKAPQYLQTVHKGGYCLIAPVVPVQAEATPASKSDTRSRTLPSWLLYVLIAGFVAAFLYLAIEPSGRPLALRPLIPLTSEPGREIDPAISPDGKRVAYLASGAGGYELLMRKVEGGAPLRLTGSALTKGHPVWSPSGDRIAFVGAQGAAAGIYIISSKGGEPVKLVDLPSWSYGLDWSPDGRSLAFSDAAPGEAPRIVLINISSKAARPVALSDNSAGDVKPVFSPDGTRVSFLRRDQLGRQQIAVVNLAGGGAAEILKAPPQELRGLDWAPDGLSLIYSAKSGRRYGLWRIKADGSAPAQAQPMEGGDLYNPSVSSDGRVVVEEVEQDRDVWGVVFGQSSATPLIRSTSGDYDPAYAPGGNRMAFVSERSGTPEVWVHSTGAEVRRRTNLLNDEIRNISWSPDGTQLAFVAEKGGAAAIYTARVLGGNPVRMLRKAEGLIPIGWAAGGNAIFLLASENGFWRLEEFNVAERTRRLIAEPRLRLAAVSADGRSIFALPASGDMLFQIVPGRGTVRQFRLPSTTGVVALLPAPEALFIVEKTSGPAAIHRLNLRSGEIRVVGRLDDYYGGALSVNDAGRAIAFTRARETANDLAWTQLFTSSSHQSAQN